MPVSCNRRTFLAGLGATALASLAPVPLRASPTVKVQQIQVISHLPHRYHGWPTLARRANGDLLLVCSGGREAHVCPFGRVELMRSHDEGRNWTWPEVVMDGPIDDRDAGVLETAQGTLLVTTFTSLAYVPILQKAQQAGDWNADRLTRWQSAYQRIDEEKRKQALGVWMKRSTNGGVTWSERYDSLVNSPHGPIQLSEGRLLYAGKDLWREPHRVGVCESHDDGVSWQWLAEIPVRPGDDPDAYHEMHAVEIGEGRILAHIRNHNPNNSREILQSETMDGGKSWSVPRPIGVWGLPSHLLRLRDGRLLMSYGHRRKPFGVQSRISADHGNTWSEPLTVSSDGVSGDLGYPSTVELDDGSLLTVWYERMQDSSFARLRQARWKLE